MSARLACRISQSGPKGDLQSPKRPRPESNRDIPKENGLLESDSFSHSKIHWIFLSQDRPSTIVARGHFDNISSFSCLFKHN